LAEVINDSEIVYPRRNGGAGKTNQKNDGPPSVGSVLDMSVIGEVSGVGPHSLPGQDSVRVWFQLPYEIVVCFHKQ